jgi:methyl-accepting chemotaxis protein
MNATESMALPRPPQEGIRRLHSLEWRLIAPVPIIVVLAIALIWVVIPHLIAVNSTNEAIRASQQIAAQFKAIRAYYTDNVINKVVKFGILKPSVDHKSEDKTIPLPATFIHDLSALLAEKDTTISLFSKYPFPNRASRRLDAFQQEAWDFLNRNPAAVFSRNEVRNGKPVVRVAVADTMAVPACVNCHNTNAASPKKDWKLGDVRGVLEVVSAIDGQLADGATLSRSIIVGAVLIGLVLLGISLLSARSVTKPLQAMVAAMGRLAAGRFDMTLPGLGRKDEIGQMAKAVVVFRDAALEKQRLEGQTAEQRRAAEEERQRNAEAQARAAEEQAAAVRALAQGLGRLAEGDLTCRLDQGFTDAYRQIRDDFNTTVERLRETIEAVAAAAREVAGASAEISGGTTDLSQRTEEQAASLEQTSASMEQISATVKRNAESAQQANQFASGTRAVADRGGAVVAQAVSAMARIEESSRRIADIIGVIDEISRQTNLLALNAAVEAARAGEAGRGFAVVASEVRSLAQRSSQAAKDIKDLITSSSGQVQEGVELVNRAGASLTEIVDSIKQVAGIVSQIAAASAEQATGIDQVNTALTQMDEVTQQNSALVEQNAAAAKALEQQSQLMHERMSFFQLALHARGGSQRPKEAA